MSVFDVAAYILERCGEMSTMKLQKLVYYSQAWSLVWDDEPLFEENIEAWANGPVVPSLYNRHRGYFKVTNSIINGNPDLLNEDQKETVRVVCEAHGNLNAQDLIDLTHSEDPWKNAHIGLQDGERGHNVMSMKSMSEYYSNLTAES